MSVERGKIVIIGAGHVGSAILNALLGMNLAKEIVLINLDREQALGEALDASHTLAFSYSAGCAIRVGDYPDCAGAQIIINTAGPSIKPGESRDRMQLLQTNLNVMTSIMDGVTRYTRDAIFINVTNPVDVLTYFCIRKYAGRSSACGCEERDGLCAWRAWRHGVYPMEHGQCGGPADRPV